VGRVIINADQNSKKKIAWGIGYQSKNLTEVLALYQGINILIEDNINEAIILGDSALVMHSHFFNTPPSNLRMECLFMRTREEMRLMEQIHFFFIIP